MFFHLLPGFGTPFTWVGLGGDANWSTPTNWSESVVPGAADVAYFDDRCIANCDPIVDVSVSVSGLVMKSTYLGTITQGAGQSMTIGSGGWTQESGQFNGSDADINFNDFGFLNLSGLAVFHSTSAQTYFNINGGSRAILAASVGTTLTFPNNSTQKFRVQAACGGLVFGLSSPNKMSFYNLVTETFNVGCGAATLGTGSTTYEIRNDYLHNSGETIILSGNFEVYGNIVAVGSTQYSATWTILGNTSKTFSGGGGIGNVIMNKTGGATLAPIDAIQTFSIGGLDIRSGEFTFPQTLNMVWSGGPGDFFKVAGGTIVNVPLDSTIAINVQGACGSPTRSIDVNGSFNFENLSMIGSNTGCGGGAPVVLAGGDALVVKKDFTLGPSFLANFNITVEGSIIIAGETTGSMAITATTGNSKTISQSHVAVVSGLVTVSKSGGTLTAGTNLSFTNSGQSLNISNGLVDLNGRNLSVNSVLTIGANAKLLCNGGSAVAASWVVDGEVSCGSSIGITWTGSAGDNLWSTSGNWTNNTVPGAGDIAIFNGMCTGLNCNAQMDSNISVRGIALASSYPGTLTQNPTRTLTIGSAGFLQSGGTFAGGDAEVSLNGPMSISAGVFTSTMGQWGMAGNLTISGSPTFNHNNGTWGFYGTGTIVPNGVTLNHAIFTGNDANYNFSGGTLIVAGLLTLSDNSVYSGGLNNGTIEVLGNIDSQNYGKHGNATLLIKGSGAQSMTGISSSRFCSVEVNKPSGTLTLLGTINIMTNWTHTTGLVDAGTSELNFWGSGLIRPGNVDYYRVGFRSDGITSDLSTGTMKVTNTLLLHDTSIYSGNINNGTIEVFGDIDSQGYGKQGSALILIKGTASQTMTGIGSSRFGPIQIDKPSGTLTMVGTINAMGNWTYTAGTVDAGTSELNFWNSSTIIPGSVIYNNVGFRGDGVSSNLSAGTMIVNGTLTLSDSSVYSGTVNNGTIEARGNVTSLSYGKMGTATVRINGTGAQSLSGVNNSRISLVEISKPSGTLALIGTIAATSSWVHTAGTVDAGTSTVYFDLNASIVPGPVDYFNVTFAGGDRTYQLNGGTMSVTGQLTINDWGTYYGAMNNGVINASGNVSFAGNGRSGNLILNLIGATSRTFSSTTTANMLDTTIVSAKTGGASVVLASNVGLTTTGRNFNISSGTLDLSGYDFSVNNILTISTGATLKCNGGEFSAGTLSNSGTVNCPGYSTYDFNWTGAGGDSNWTTAGNWQGGVVPSVTDVVVFENTYCGANCNSTVNASSSVRGVRIFSPYTGAVAQSVGAALTVGSRGWSQSAGTFTGSNSDITMNGPLSLSSGVFTSTSGTLSVGGNFNTIAGTFHHNNGTVQFINTSLVTLAPGAHAYNNVTFPEVAGCTEWSLVGSLNVYGNLLFNTSYWCGGNRPINGGTIRAYANVTSTNAGATGNTTLLISGNAAGQTITGTSGSMPGLTIAAGVHSVTLSGTIITTGDYTVSSVGNLVTTGSTLIFAKPVGVSITPGAWAYNNVVIDGTNTFRNFDLNGNTMTIDGNLTLSGDGWGGGLRVINNGILAARGNVTVSDSGLFGTAEIHFLGNSDSTLTMSQAGNIPEGDITINKTGGSKLTLTSAVRFNRTVQQDLTITSGTLDLAGYDLVVGNNISNLGTLIRGSNPGCGTITQGGAFTGNAALCP